MVHRLCVWAGLDCEVEVFNLFAGSIPQEGLSRMERGRKLQSIVPDLRISLPNEDNLVPSLHEIKIISSCPSFGQNPKEQLLFLVKPSLNAHKTRKKPLLWLFQVKRRKNLEKVERLSLERALEEKVLIQWWIVFPMCHSHSSPICAKTGPSSSRILAPYSIASQLRLFSAFGLTFVSFWFARNVFFYSSSLDIWSA